MSKSKTRGKSRALQKFIMIIIILIIVILSGFFCIYRPLKQRFVSAVTQELISSQLSSGELSDDDVAAIMDSMSAEDRAILEDIVNSHFSVGAVSDVLSYLRNGDLAGLREYAENSLTEDELAQIRTIYEKYQDVINSYLE